MKKMIPWLVLLLAINLLLELLEVYAGNIASWATFVLVALVGVALVMEKKITYPGTKATELKFFKFPIFLTCVKFTLLILSSYL